MRWGDRLIGVGSTLVLARLLTPEDFGLVAMAMIVAGLLDVLLDLGVGAALIQNKAADRLDFDTAWTLRLCQMLVAAGLIAVGAPFAAQFYEDPRVCDVLWVISASIVIGGFENIGIVTFQKNLEFGRDFRFFFAKRLLTTSAVIILAFTLRSYWALVLGGVFGRLAGVALSYAMHDFRPRFSLSRAKQIWSFSQWNMLFSIGVYVSSRLDKLVLGRRADAGVLGAYSLGDEIASLPTTELLAPMGRVMFPMFVDARNDPREFERIVRLAFSSQALLGLPAGIGISLVAPEAVPIILGAQWGAAVPIVQILGLVGAMTALTHTGYYLLMTIGQIKTLALYFVSQVVLLLGLLHFVFNGPEAQSVAFARLTLAVVALFVMLALILRALPNLGARGLLAEVQRPIFSSVVMAAVVIWAGVLLDDVATPLRLMCQVATGGIVYGIMAVAMWLLAGKPEGAESYLLSKLPNRLQRF